MSARTHDPEIRKGDLVKATRRESPDLSIQGRVEQVTSVGVSFGILYPAFSVWDFEVLDRPLPPIDVDLLNGAINVWRDKKFGFEPSETAHESPAYAEQFTAVINFVRQYDAEHNNKESK